MLQFFWWGIQGWLSCVLWLKISLKSNHCVGQDWGPVAACLAGVTGAGVVAYRHTHTVVGGVQLFMVVGMKTSVPWCLLAGGCPESFAL